MRGFPQCIDGVPFNDFKWAITSLRSVMQKDIHFSKAERRLIFMSSLRRVTVRALKGVETILIPPEIARKWEIIAIQPARKQQ
jgi:hypothetical protein